MQDSNILKDMTLESFIHGRINLKPLLTPTLIKTNPAYGMEVIKYLKNKKK